MTRTPHDQLVHFLSDLYSVELQALAQLKSAPDLAGDAEIATPFHQHCGETEAQADLVRDRLQALGGSPSAIKDGLMKMGGKGFLLFAKLQLETPGRLVTHAYSYEAMEWAGYEVLARFAEHDGDGITAELARRIQAEERTMMERLEACFDRAEAVSHERTSPENFVVHVRKHLAEVHALESQSLKLMERSGAIGGDAELEALYAQHAEETRKQMDWVEQRLRDLEADRPLLQDAALKLGALNWGMFFQLQADTPAKLAAFAYAVEHLELAAYELLSRVARRAGDGETGRLCGRILHQEHAMTKRIADRLDHAVRITLTELGATR
jgi:ferritin-like metal-binding protein YciE